MKAQKVILSKRFQMLADMVTPGNRLVDVGCDHGFLSIYLVQKEICPRALAMDVRKGPLEAAREHVQEASLSSYIETRLSDGLKSYGMGEADTMVCAGMGGPLMEKILTDSMDKARGLKELILQPQSEIKEFRQFLRENGFRIVAEDAVIDEGKYYFAMKAVYDIGGIFEGQGAEEGEACTDDRQMLYDTYGKELLVTKHPVLLAFLEQRMDYLEQLELSLEAIGTQKAIQRLGDVKKELSEIAAAYEFFCA